MAVFQKRYVRVNATADGNQTIIAAPTDTNKRIVVVGYSLTLTGTAAGASSLQDTAGSPVIFATFTLAAANTALPLCFAGDEDNPAFSVTEGLALVVANAANVDLTGHLTYALTE